MTSSHYFSRRSCTILVNQPTARPATDHPSNYPPAHCLLLFSTTGLLVTILTSLLFNTPHDNMGQPSLRRRSKRLLSHLKDLQGRDGWVTPPTIFAMKHLLQLSNRCKLVGVKIDSFVANCPHDSCRSLLPEFIVSQLEAQKLTDRLSETVPVPPIVAFVIQSLPSAVGSDTLYPTLFRWYYPPTCRTYYVFAHISHSMARRTYTLTELMGFRTNQVSGDILAMTGNPEIGMCLSPSLRCHWSLC